MNVYEMAAERLAETDPTHRFCCNSIAAVNGSFEQHEAFTELFKPALAEISASYEEDESISYAWGQYWGPLGDCEQANECRLLALCFAAAMHDAGDL